MQLILEIEAADITQKMATVEESLDNNLKNDSIENLKNDICNGNKENIECKKNLNTSVAANSKGDNHRESSGNQSESNAEVKGIESETKNDDPMISSAGDVKVQSDNDKTESGELAPSNENTYDNSNSNGIKNAEDTNGDGRKCEENLTEEKEASSKNIISNDTVRQEADVISLSSKEEVIIDSECKKSNNSDKNTAIEDNINNTEIVKNALKILGNEIDLDISENSDSQAINIQDKIIGKSVNDISEIEVDKTISEMAMNIDDHVLEDNNTVDVNMSEDAILIDEVDLDDVAPKTEDSSKSVAPVEAESDVEILPENVTNLDLEKPDDKESETAVAAISSDVIDVDVQETEPALVVLEKTESENLAENAESVCETINYGTTESVAPVIEESNKDNSETHTLDDDVIQIESEQDSEALVIESKDTANKTVDQTEKVIKDVTQLASDVDKTIMEDTSKAIVNNISEDKSDKIDCVSDANPITQSNDDKVEILDVDDIKDRPEKKKLTQEPKVDTTPTSIKVVETEKQPVLKLSNTLDILSDDDEDQPPSKPPKAAEPAKTEKERINDDDDDVIMLIDDTEVSNAPAQPMEVDEKENKPSEVSSDVKNEDVAKTIEVEPKVETVAETNNDPVPAVPEVKSDSKEQESSETINELKEEINEPPKPLLPENFLKSCKKNLADMTRDELEEFCILKIVESIVDRSNLGEIKSKLKIMAQNIEEHKKKAMMLTKQNRDLQLVLKSVQEEQKKKSDTAIIPLKITRSVGMQVLMTEKITGKKKPNSNALPTVLGPPTASRNIRTPNQSPRGLKPAGNQQIPVPRLVPAAANPVAKSPMMQSPVNNQTKTANQFNGARGSPAQKAEKRPHNRVQSVTVDLTDDEPPTKVAQKNSPAPPVRLVSTQNLLSAPRQQLATSLNSPRKVYIPISGPQGNIRAGQTIMLKSVPPPGPRQRAAVPTLTRGPSPNVIKRVTNNRHPAPLPDAMKQYQPPNWKALPPAPDLKLSKVENGIVISWKIEGYHEDSYEEIASYQLYAYQETSSPPSTVLWKKIGDVKALPLPMACTLTQFMAGFKYYFAVRAVDVRSRLGPFSLPGSILLLNKM